MKLFNVIVILFFLPILGCSNDGEITEQTLTTDIYYSDNSIYLAISKEKSRFSWKAHSHTGTTKLLNQKIYLVKVALDNNNFTIISSHNTDISDGHIKKYIISPDNKAAALKLFSRFVNNKCRNFGKLDWFKFSVNRKALLIRCENKLLAYSINMTSGTWAMSRSEDIDSFNITNDRLKDYLFIFDNSEIIDIREILNNKLFNLPLQLQSILKKNKLIDKYGNSNIIDIVKYNFTYYVLFKDDGYKIIEPDGRIYKLPSDFGYGGIPYYYWDLESKKIYVWDTEYDLQIIIYDYGTNKRIELHDQKLLRNGN